MLPCALALRDTRRESQGVAGQVDRRGAGVTRQSDEWPGGCASQSVSLRGPPIAKTGSNGTQGTAGGESKTSPPRSVAAMPETMEVSKEAVSGDGTVENVGIKVDAKFKCPHCRQAFSEDKALQLHLKFQCPTAIAKQINPVGD